MASTSSAPRVAWWRKPVTKVVAGVAAAGLLVTGAVVAQGYDAQELPRVESGVWVARDSGQYARVNTDLGEIDTVRSVQDPSTIAQFGASTVLFGQGNRQFWTVDPALPAELLADGTDDSSAGSAGADAVISELATATPAGTRSIATAGDFAVALTDVGTVFLATLSGTEDGFVSLNPYADVEVAEGEDAPVYVASAASVSPSGDVVLYSAAEGGIRRFDAEARTFTGGLEEVSSAPDATEPVVLTMVGATWVLHAPGEQLVWIDGRGEPVATTLGADSVIQEPSAEASSVWVADSTGIVSIDLSSGAVSAPAGGGATPAVPVVVDGVAYGAWLSEDGGSLFASNSSEIVTLETEPEPLEGISAVVPVIRSNGDRAVLNEMATGMLWTIPDGQLISVDQWNIDNEDDVEDGTIIVDDADQQEPPTAVADSFGVRSGALVSLPLLYNDHDPNRADVLTIDRPTLGALSDPGFGTLGLVGNSQTATVRVTAASGAASFTYAASDGAATSSPASVTLTVVPPDVNSAPVWCGVENCVQTWPTPTLAPGGTISVPVLGGWVDPEGDPFVLADVRKTNVSDPLAVVATADGSVAIRHTDPNAASGAMTVTVVLMDSFGAVVEKDLTVTVTGAPQLELRPSAITAAVGELATIEVTSLVNSGSGSYRLVDAIDGSSVPGTLTVAPNSSANSIDVSAPTPGEYLVSFAVQDTVTLAEKTANVRVSIVPVSSTISIAPLTAFVRPGEDVTVGVLDAVQNDTGRVLIVSEVTPRQPQITASVVAQAFVRVRGTTPDGLPGPIGTVGVVVTDGAGAFVEGEITVFLVQPARDITPIAVPDTVTVRAGAQVDIPVLANDVSPRGEKLAVSPVLVTSETAGELAFVANGVVRYLAPTVPGTYTVTYSAYLEGAPDRLAAASISITVLAPGSNRAPQPRPLIGRALAGGTTEVAVPLVGVDPDGDSVALVSVTQPASGEGSASISADGTVLIYRAPAAGVADGQTSFTYTLRDSGGESARGTVRIGVLSTETADMTPLTFSTQVRAQVGSNTALTVMPMLTDSDPAGGTLELISLVPNAPANSENPEYARLDSLIDSATSLEDGIVSLRAGDVIGSHSYIYTVQSSKTSSTAQGLIVVGVSESVAADLPVVIDTTVTLVNRDQLASGIDVVADKVQWVSGDPSSLELSVWGSAADTYSASGSQISGPLPRAGTLVPFELSGLDSNGEQISAFGFLRVPSIDDMRIQTRVSAAPVVVDEEASVRIAVADFVQIGSTDTLEIRDDEPFVVQRANAKCTLDDSGRVSYSAGREAPWSDSCTTFIRVDGQSTWTTVSIPIVIVPKDPQAILSAISRTIAPGATESADLYNNMTTWEGGREGNRSELDFATSYSGSSFTVVQSGNSVSFEAHANAVPGTRESVIVSVTGFGGLTSAISLVVGIAPPDAPKGASFSHQCTVSAGASCVIPAIGLAGEYDPFSGKTGGGLTLSSVTSQSCSVATISVSGSKNLVATWPSSARPAGGDCTATFAVKDAQGRSGLGELRLDVLGYPAAPSSVTTQNFGPDWVDLRVELGEASLAHPALSGVAIYENGSAVSASCSPGSGAYTCRVNGLTHGVHHFYTARAVNSVGESLDTTAHETWAYDFPVVSAVSGVAVYEAGRTSLTAGAVDLSITAGASATELKVIVDGGVIATFAGAGGTINERVTIEGTGTRNVVVEPNSGTIVPPLVKPHDGSKSATVTVAGTPSIAGGESATATSTSVTASFGATNANGSTTPLPVQYGISTSTALSCTGTTGTPTVVGATTTGTSSTFTGLAGNVQYYVIACFGNGFGVATSPGLATAFTWTPPGAPTGTLSYTIPTTPTAGGSVFSWALTSSPVVDDPGAPYAIRYNVGSGATDGSSSWSLGMTNVAYCIPGQGCGPTSSITSATGLTTPFTVNFVGVTGTCSPAPPAPVDPPDPDADAAALAAAIAQAKGNVSFSDSSAQGAAIIDAVWNDGTASWDLSVTWSSGFPADPVNYSCSP